MCITHTPRRSIPFIAHLPSPTPLVSAPFVWHDCEPSTFIPSVSAAYSEVVHWKKNIFQVPFGQSGKKFVLELIKLFRVYSECSALECVALKVITVLSILVLQKPSRKSKSKNSPPVWIVVCLHGIGGISPASLRRVSAFKNDSKRVSRGSNVTRTLYGHSLI